MSAAWAITGKDRFGAVVWRAGGVPFVITVHHHNGINLYRADPYGAAGELVSIGFKSVDEAATYAARRMAEGRV
jgi:hypothetical protein